MMPAKLVCVCCEERELLRMSYCVGSLGRDLHNDHMCIEGLRWICTSIIIKAGLQ